MVQCYKLGINTSSIEYVLISVSSKAFMKAQPVIDLLCELLPHGESQRMSDRRWQMKPGMAREFLDAIKGDSMHII